MLNTITFKKDYRCFKEGDSFDFRPGVNLIVGDQGTGKSTLLSNFHRGKKQVGEYMSVKAEKVPYYYFDFEKHNPRMKGRVETEFQVAAIMSSHGQMNLAIVKGLIRELKEPSLILMDEADMALSIRSCYELVSILKDLESKGHQILAIVHNIVVISQFKDVLSLEHKRWMTSSDFIRSQQPEQQEIKVTVCHPELTSDQIRYIATSHKRYTIEEMSNHLDIPRKDIYRVIRMLRQSMRSRAFHLQDTAKKSIMFRKVDELFPTREEEKELFEEFISETTKLFDDYLNQLT